MVFRVHLRPLSHYSVRVIHQLVRGRGVQLTRGRLSGNGLYLLSAKGLKRQFLSLFLKGTRLASSCVVLFFGVMSTIFLRFFFRYNVAYRNLFKVVGLGYLYHDFRFFFPTLRQDGSFARFLLGHGREVFGHGLFWMASLQVTYFYGGGVLVAISFIRLRVPISRLWRHNFTTTIPPSSYGFFHVSSFGVSIVRGLFVNGESYSVTSLVWRIFSFCLGTSN